MPRSLAVLTLCFGLGALSACGSDPLPASTGGAGSGGVGNSTTSGGAGGAAPDAGTVQIFATLPTRSEGIAFGPGPDGQRVLYVGIDDEVLRVAPDGSTVKHVALPSPVGIAVRADGDLLVCGKSEAGGEMSAVVWRVTPLGEKSVFVGPGTFSFQLTNFVAVAPDDSIVFSDSPVDKLYRAAPDGSNVELVTSAITFPNGLAFSRDGKTLYVASWDAKKVYSLARNDDGSYGAPEVFMDGIDNVDGLATFDSGDLLFISNLKGLLRVGLDHTKTVIAPATKFGLPANGAFAAGPYGDGWVYVTNFLGQNLSRVYVGSTGAPLPAR